MKYLPQTIPSDLTSALENYPVYAPPHDGLEMYMREQYALENFNYFLEHKKERLQALQGFFKKLGHSLDFTDNTRYYLDSWFSKYGRTLMPSADTHAYYSNMVKWDGDKLMLNIIHDLSVFLGEFFINKNANYSWTMFSDVTPYMKQRLYHFQKAVILHKADGNTHALFAPMQSIFELCFSNNPSIRNSVFSSGLQAPEEVGWVSLQNR
jgi:hypothetical protein